MRLEFNIDYQTKFGEQLVLNIINGERTEHHPMNSLDGIHWTLEMTSVWKCGASLDYYYSVVLGDLERRHEWLVVPHKLELNAQQGVRYIVHDRWIDLPDDSSLYSSAFTDCVQPAHIELSPRTNFSRTLRLKVRAPQLRSHERLALVGEPTYLGGWDCGKALPMVQHACHEWVVSVDADRLPEVVEFKFVILGGQAPLWENANNRVLLIPEMMQGDTLVFEQQPAWFSIPQWKGAGTVIPVFSLRSEGSFGVGDFGDLKMMVDWCAKTRQNILQVLPVNDTNITHTWQDSYPYNSISIYALHPQYVDVRQLPPLKDADKAARYEQLRLELNALPQVDYERVNRAKMDYLQDVYQQEWGSVRRRAAYQKFYNDNKDWLEPYALFCFYRDFYGTATFSKWPSALEKPVKKTLEFWYFVQYCLDQQMRAAHDYARRHHVILKGDIPIGISRDGVEAWVEPRYFNLNGQAGAPPDAFSANGQNWGFPTYNWDEMLRDDCSWWVRRFRKMAEYFDAYRIDHVLGFFRIWEIPIHSVHGLLGQFSPSQGMTVAEIESYGLHFKEDEFTKPFIVGWTLKRLFGNRDAYAKAHYLNPLQEDRWELKPQFDTQRKVEAWYQEQATACQDADKLSQLAADRDTLYSMVSDVLFVRDTKNRDKYHPRIGVQNDFAYEMLWDSDKDAFNRLYNDYYYRRNNQFWYYEAMKKLPRLTEATRMLVCAEDLGMVPDCVKWVMNELKILSLEIQSMPKESHARFGHLSANPYRSVSTISTHDMPTLRQWWDEDPERTQAYYNQMLSYDGTAPHPLTGRLAQEIVSMHLMSPSMLCLLSLQDWLSIDETLRLPNADDERINIPANPRHYWRYRMHLTIEQLLQADDFNREVTLLIKQSGR